MLKVLLLLFGLAGGAVGATSWLLSEPGSASAPQLPLNSEALQERWRDLQTRLNEAVADGQRARQETEDRLRRELDAYRRGANPPAA